MNIVVIGGRSVIGSYLTKKLRIANHRVFPFSRPDCDASKFETLEKCAKQLQSQINTVDALVVCSATVMPIGTLTSVEANAWSRAIDVNLKGPFYAFRAFHALLKKSRHPKVIFFSGGGATKARPHFLAYAVSKTGLVRGVETLAAEEPGMDVNAIAPGTVKSPLTDIVLSVGAEIAGEKEYVAAATFNTKALPEVYNLVNFLLSSAGDGISGLLIAAQFDEWRKFTPENIGANYYRLRREIGPHTKP